MSLKVYRPKTYLNIEDLPHENINYVSNLFVISNLGQLKHVTGLIEKMNITNSFLLVVYTDANLTVPQLIHGMFNLNAFDGVLFHKLPVNPNSILFSNIKLIEANYRKILKAINPRTLYLNSFQFHYAILANIAKRNKVKLILIEEGLGTYRLEENENYEPNGSVDFDLVRKLSRETLSQTEVFKRMYKKYKLTKEFVTEAKRLAKMVCFSPEVQSKIVNIYPNSNFKSFYKPFVDFDESFTSFPDLTKKTFKVSQSNYYLSFEKPTQDEKRYALSIIDKYNIKPKDYIYLSQKFRVNTNEYLRIIKTTLLNLIESTESNIFVKLHPKKEPELVMKGFLDLERETKGRIKVIKESDFLIEEVIRLSKVQGIIGITSSALVYSPLIAPECKSMSIAYILTKNLLDNKNNKKGVEMIKSHTKILEKFDNIFFLE
ncbi:MULTISPECIES: alpha-2,8-polysialyltransferase family protein [unclassified Psychrobacter]|uniref:alpha-2,8-polysialyltransferase family protein n=1 Tax=unclassified Psychrobacter TaxID=196806 RepID=UPI003F44FFBB